MTHFLFPTGLVVSTSNSVSIRTLAAVVSGMALGLAQSPVPHSLLAAMALVPWILATRSSSGPGEVAVLACVFVITYGSIVIHWLPSAWESLGMISTSGPVLVIACSLFAAIPMFLPVGLLIRHTRSMGNAVVIAVPSVSLAAIEWVYAGWGFAIPWAHVGHSQIGSLGVAQLALVGGVPLVSMVVVSINIALALCVESWTGHRLRIGTSLVGSWCALAIFGLPASTFVSESGQKGSVVRVLIAQPNLHRGERWVDELQPLNFERFVSVVHRAITEKGRVFDVVVGPENLLTSQFDEEGPLKDMIQNEVDSIGRPLVLGAIRLSTRQPPSRYRSSAVWISPQLGIVSSVDKERAVPLIEAAPKSSIEERFGSLLGIASETARVEVSNGGTDLRHTFPVTPVLCWEALFAGLVEARRAPDSRFILNLADDSWTESDSATRQLTDFVRFRAIEQRLPLVRVAHGGLSVVIDRYGRISSALPMDRYAYALTDIPEPVLATKLEKIVILLLPIAAAMGVWWGWRLVTRLLRAPEF